MNQLNIYNVVVTGCMGLATGAKLAFLRCKTSYIDIEVENLPKLQEERISLNLGLEQIINYFHQATEAII